MYVNSLEFIILFGYKMKKHVRNSLFSMFKKTKFFLLACCFCNFVTVCAFAEAAPKTCAALATWKKSKMQQSAQEITQHHKEIKAMHKKALQDIDEHDESWLKAQGQWASQMEKQYATHKKILGCKDDEDKV